MINNMGAVIAEVQKLQEEMRSKAIEVSEGDGAVRVVMNGYQEILDVRISPSALKPEKANELQAMVAAAFSRALAESKQMIRDEIAKITGGLSMPNISGLF